MINIKDFDSRLSKIDKKSCKQVDTYYIGYIVKEKNDSYENIYNVSLLCFIVEQVDGHTEKRKWICIESKYLASLSTDGDKKALKKNIETSDEIKYLLKTIVVKRWNMEKISWNLNLIW